MSDRKPAAITFNKDVASTPEREDWVDLTMDDDTSPPLPSPVLTPRSLRAALDPAMCSPRMRAPLMGEEIDAFVYYAHERIEHSLFRLDNLERNQNELIEPEAKRLRVMARSTKVTCNIVYDKVKVLEDKVKELEATKARDENRIAHLEEMFTSFQAVTKEEIRRLKKEADYIANTSCETKDRIDALEYVTDNFVKDGLKNVEVKQWKLEDKVALMEVKMDQVTEKIGLEVNEI